jgi:hypothetical protein
MTQPFRPVRAISLDSQRGWCVIHLPDDSLQLDMGTSGVVFAPGEFDALADMLRTARSAPDGEEVLAVLGPQRHILFYELHQTVVITFGRAILRLSPADFEALVRLCDHARAELGRWSPGPLRLMRQPSLEPVLN